MHDRTALGPGDVDDAALTAMVADLLGHDPSEVRLLRSSAEPASYDLPSITTVGRHWVTGTARTPRGEMPFRLFVKRVQAWRHSPFFAGVPPQAREVAAASVPWRTEARVYASDLHTRLPDGLSMPRALAIVDVDPALEPDAVAVWLPEVEHAPTPWTLARYERSAYLLGRLAASASVAERADVGEFEWTVMSYVHGRVAMQVAPRLLAEDTWADPLIAEHFGDLRPRLEDASARACDLALELLALPMTTSHGDACPNNLLPSADEDEFVLIDFGFWHPQPVGFDLGQLVAGEIQLGRGSAAGLPDIDAACVSAYTRGLADEGLVLDESVVRRAHALHLMIFVGLSSLPDEPSAASAYVAERAALARFSLDLLDATGG